MLRKQRVSAHIGGQHKEPMSPTEYPKTPSSAPPPNSCTQVSNPPHLRINKTTTKPVVSLCFSFLFSLSLSPKHQTKPANFSNACAAAVAELFPTALTHPPSFSPLCHLLSVTTFNPLTSHRSGIITLST